MYVCMYVCKTLRQYLNPIYVMLHLSGFKTLILSKGFICYRIEVLTQAVYLKAPKFLSPLTGKLKTDFYSQIFKGLTPESHLYNTRWKNLGYLYISSYQTKTYCGC